MYAYAANRMNQYLPEGIIALHNQFARDAIPHAFGGAIALAYWEYPEPPPTSTSTSSSPKTRDRASLTRLRL